jgi:CRISPR-associated protein Cas4
MISVSTLTSYQYCARKFYLDYVLKLARPPKASLIKGTIRHQLHDFLNKKEKEIVKDITKEFDLVQTEELYLRHYSEALREAIRNNRSELEKLQIDMRQLFKETWPLILSESKLRATNTFKFAQRYNVFGDELWEKLTPKIESEFFLESQNIGLRGIIDQVEIYENDFVPYELKTGKMPEKGVWPNHKIQTGAYILLLQEKFNKPVKEAFVKYLDFDEARQVTMNPFLKEEIFALIKKVNETLIQKELPVYTQNENKCKNCELNNECHDEPMLRSLLLNNH